MLFIGMPLRLFAAEHTRSVTPHPTTAKGWVPEAPARILLTVDDGLAVLGAALESRRPLSRASDCSHLVHAIYERAGFPYVYANSVELYAGADQFEVVSRPQPGDLIVWKGHVGIVISPADHSFFSALRAGRGVERYDSVYWKGRGRPKFLRYIKLDVGAGFETPLPAE